MATIIDGKAVSAKLREELREKARILTESGMQPGLAVLLVGDDPASAIYVRNKEKACAECGFYSVVERLPAGTTQEALLARIAELAADSRIHGILVQLPLPKHISEEAVIAAIPPEKDVDAFHAQNVGRILLGSAELLPCTPAGVMALLDAYQIDPAGKRCVVVGRSNIVGKPMALLLLHRHGTVTICHSRTAELAEELRRADIVVAAVGRAEMIDGAMLKEGAVVIDVGMNRNAEGKLCGDVHFPSASEKAAYITPVPGGVGPMTITMLLRNTLRAAELQK